MVYRLLGISRNRLRPLRSPGREFDSGGEHPRLDFLRCHARPICGGIFHTPRWRFGRFLVGTGIAGTYLFPLFHSPDFLSLVPAYRFRRVRDIKHLSTDFFQPGWRNR